VAFDAVPVTSPVTSPVKSPMNVVAVVVPDTFTFWRKVAFVLVLMLSVTAIPVSADPSIAGSVDGNLASGIVPEFKFDAFRADPVIKPAPLVSWLLLEGIVGVLVKLL
jgi:hypothetical protein